MVADYRYHRLDGLRDYLSIAVYPIQWIVDTPVRFSSSLRTYAHSFHYQIKENERLKQEQFLQSAQLQKLMSLETENTRLRELLHSTPRKGETFSVAEIIRVSSDPFVHRVVLNKGRKQGVSLGQPVIDAEGVIGEVIEVNPSVSRIILLTDANYGIAVENVRSGVRGIAAGTGAHHRLELQHVANTVDLKIGDTLVTSGLDGRYPPGYPVGVIHSIEHDPSEAFARVNIRPLAHLDRSRQVLLLKHSSKDEP